MHEFWALTGVLQVCCNIAVVWESSISELKAFYIRLLSSVFQATWTLRTGEVLCCSTVSIPPRDPVRLCGNCKLLCNSKEGWHYNYTVVAGKAQLDSTLLTKALAIKLKRGNKNYYSCVCVWRGEEEIGSGHMALGRENLEWGKLRILLVSLQTTKCF